MVVCNGLMKCGMALSHTAQGREKDRTKTQEQTSFCNSYLHVVRVNSGKHGSHCHSLMSCCVLKASLHIVVTLKESAGYLAEQFISVGAVEAGGLEFTLSSLWTLLYHYGGMSHKHGCLYFKGSLLNPDTSFSCSVQLHWENMLHVLQQQSQSRSPIRLFFANQVI